MHSFEISGKLKLGATMMTIQTKLTGVIEQGFINFLENQQEVPMKKYYLLVIVIHGLFMMLIATA